MRHARSVDEAAAMRFLPGRARWLRVLAIAALALLAGFLLVQAVPYGRNHSNPPVTQEPKWDSPTTRALAVRACFDCHSNQTKWRWYSNIAPISWLIQRDVDGGRAQFNFSEWNKPQDVSSGDLADAIRNGSMPPWFYTLPHRSALLSNAEKSALIKGLAATLNASPPRSGPGG
jgi:Haem-binding domain